MSLREAAQVSVPVPLAFVLGGTVLGLMVVSTVAPGAHRELAADLGADWPAIAGGRLWRVPTSSLLQEDSGIVWPIVVLLGVLPAAELRFGALRTLGIWVLADATATVGGLAALELTGMQRLASAANLGSSAALIGLLAAWTAAGGGRLRTVGPAVLAVGLVAALVVDPELTTAQHLVGGATGAALGSWWAHGRPAE